MGLAKPGLHGKFQASLGYQLALNRYTCKFHEFSLVIIDMMSQW